MLSKIFTSLSSLAAGLVLLSGVALAMPAYHEPAGMCTRDINPCDNPSICMCGAGYDYNAAAGLCVAATMADVTGPGGARLTDSRCVAEPVGICTMDVNAAGHASICQCPSGYEYSPMMGKCVADL